MTHSPGLLECDVLIVGAGPVGAALGAALAGLPLRAVLADARPASDAGPPRTIALTAGALRILGGLGADVPGASIRQVHVTDQGHFGRVVLDAARAGVPELGRVCTEPALRTPLLARARAHPLMPARLHALRQTPAGVTAHFTAPDGLETVVNARLVLAADGTDSLTCELAGLRLHERPAETAALVGTVRTRQPHTGVAYERFTDTGPVALLPGLESDQRHFVWTLPLERAQRLAGVGVHLLTLFAQRFGHRAGAFTALEGSAMFPLREARRHPRAGRVLAVGNAAHTLHPVAAQGFNLGLRDVAVLADHLARAARAGQDVGSAPVLDGYIAARRADWLTARAFTRALPSLFAEQTPPLVLGRSAGLTALAVLPGAARAFARAAMGLRRPRSALQRGLTP